MDVFGIGPLELLVIMVIALLVIGPEKLPGMAQKIGKALGDVKRSFSEASQAVTEELRAKEIGKEMADIKHQATSELKDIQTKASVDGKPLGGEKLPDADPRGTFFEH